MVERLKPNPNNYAHPADYSKAVSKIKALRDPADRSYYQLLGYNDPVLAFKIGQVPVNYITRIDDSGDTETRVYFAGFVLLGVATKSPAMITANFQPHIGPAGFIAYKTFEQVENALANMLTGVPR